MARVRSRRAPGIVVALGLAAAAGATTVTLIGRDGDDGSRQPDGPDLTTAAVEQRPLAEYLEVTGAPRLLRFGGRSPRRPAASSPTSRPRAASSGRASSSTRSSMSRPRPARRTPSAVWPRPATRWWRPVTS